VVRVTKSERTCSVNGCDEKLLAKGLCDAHYARLRRGQSLEYPPIRGTVTVCTVADCVGRVHAVGLCEAHYKRNRLGVSLDFPVVPLNGRGTRAVLARDAMGRKHCPRCDRWLDTAEFHTQSRASDKLTTYCAGCIRARRYGTTAVVMHEIGEAQGWLCAVCPTPLREVEWHIDHDHACCPTTPTCGKCTRGFLCRPCNLALGIMHEDLKNIASLVVYLEAWQLRKQEIHG
jgi:hypothetical protein